MVNGGIMEQEVKEITPEEIPVEETTDVEDAVVEPVEEVEESTFEVICECAYLNVRENPDKDSEILCKVKQNETLVAEVYDDEWYNVFTKAGVEGFVMSKFVRKK